MSAIVLLFIIFILVIVWFLFKPPKHETGTYFLCPYCHGLNFIPDDQPEYSCRLCGTALKKNGVVPVPKDFI